MEVDLDMVALELGRLHLRNLALEKALHEARAATGREPVQMDDYRKRPPPGEGPAAG